MHSIPPGQRALVAVLSLVVVPAAFADPIAVRDVAGEVMKQFTDYPLNENILDAAKTLFTSLATISLVWTMGMLIVRQDIGEMLMELVRFIVVTGTFYWLLINASSHDGGNGFVGDIVNSFFNMVNDSTSDELIRNKANSILARGLHVFYKTVDETAGGDDGDRLLAGGIALAVLVVCAIMAAQFLLALVMAWVLGYAGIFLLGFGGARWTSSIAINFYKHVVAIGVALLALSIVGTVAAGFLDQLEFDPNRRGATDYPNLGLMLAGSIVMMVLSSKLPQLLYTLVTGSTLGMYAGSASAAGTAIATAGASAMASAAARLPGGGHGGSAAGHVESGRTDSVMGAVQRSASSASGMSDPFHVGTASDSFGMTRSPNPYHQTSGGSVFTATQSAPAAGVASVSSSASPSLAGEHGRVPAAVDAVVGSGFASASGTAVGENQGGPGQAMSMGGVATKIHDDGRGATSAGALGADRGMARPNYLAELESIEASARHAESAGANRSSRDMRDAQPMESLTDSIDLPDSIEQSHAGPAEGMSGRGENANERHIHADHVSDVGDRMALRASHEDGHDDVSPLEVVGMAHEAASKTGHAAPTAEAGMPTNDAMVGSAAQTDGVAVERNEEVRTTMESLSGVAESIALTDERKVGDADVRVPTPLDVDSEIDIASRENPSVNHTVRTNFPEQQPGAVAESAVLSSRKETADGTTAHGATANAPHAIPSSQAEVRTTTERLAGVAEPMRLPDEKETRNADVEVSTTRGVNSESDLASGGNSSVYVSSAPPVDDEHAPAREEEDRDRPPPGRGKRPGGTVIQPPTIDDASQELPE